ncbi:probable E3 ubiquitin-protein ligase makorin-1 isoform X2 [Engraulis encrasicolus]|uniref:probable E3 ubiquitin-protein ligase makorin-1 isoform X2 n=1 Tax=Engraulis encrasicolus TaxID=184585 RepID=UPI002FD08F24
MAEAAAASTAAPAISGSWTKHVTCRYFMHGLCKEGNNCRYSHDLTSSKPAMICKFFQKGYCAFGDRCRYEHTKPTKQDDLPGPKSSLLLPPTALPEAGSSDPAETLSSGPGGSGSSSSSGSGSVAATATATTTTTTTATTSTTHTQDQTDASGSGSSSGAEDWVNAAEFVPGQPYCGRAEPAVLEGSSSVAPPVLIEEEFEKERADSSLKKTLCPYAAMGECRYGLNCAYLHGDVCDMCGLQVLHPTDNAQSSMHIKACIEAHEKDMELSFAIQRSKDMMCGVCMEVVFEKSNPSERRFGILSNCSHCYCLKCIRKWRSAKQFESKIIKSCPECRITSNFVIPSEYWVEDKEEKQKLIQMYKDGMGTKACRYFDEGRGTCPFGANCFYKHAFPDGRLEEAQPQQRRQNNSNGRNRQCDLLVTELLEIVIRHMFTVNECSR